LYFRNTGEGADRRNPLTEGIVAINRVIGGNEKSHKTPVLSAIFEPTTPPSIGTGTIGEYYCSSGAYIRYLWNVTNFKSRRIYGLGM